MSDQSISDLIQQIVQNGQVTAGDVQSLEKHVESDWVVDKSEVEKLLQANHAIGVNDENCPQWSNFFVTTVTRLVVMDLFTPGEIDEDEGNWLADLLEKYPGGNETEQNLLGEIQNTTSSIAGRLGERIKPH